VILIYLIHELQPDVRHQYMADFLFLNAWQLHQPQMMIAALMWPAPAFYDF